MKTLFRTSVASLLVALAATLASPIGSAEAARTEGWSAYLWAKSGTCVYGGSGAYVDGPLRMNVARKGATTQVRSNMALGGVFSITRRGRLIQQANVTQSEAGTDVAVRGRMVYPTVAQLRKKQGGTSSRVRLRITLPQEYADSFAASGRTITLIARYRSHGLGQKAISLPQGSVTAVGVSWEMTNFATANVRPRMREFVRSAFRSLLAEAGGEEWWAPRHGLVVMANGSGEDRTVYTQRRCA